MMNYETFMKEKDRIAELPDEEQKRFYEKVLEEEKEESSVKLLAYFQYAVLFYNFRKAREKVVREKRPKNIMPTTTASGSMPVSRFCRMIS